ncbi:MAG: 23S rRNA (guanine(745)-N(1))-methyltransferase [Methylococcales bacterium]
MPYQCPVCKTPLLLNTNSSSYSCANQHHFDVAKQGYVNLLPVQHKNSKQPGDNKQMLQARREFLEAGYYQAMADNVAKLLAENLSTENSLNLLDLGCGEGYYSRCIARYFADKLNLNVHGIDIAKVAIAAAAKIQPDARFAVAGSHRLPYQDKYFDVLISIFAPANHAEICRVLKANGLLLTVTPGPRHLWQLKEFIYPQVRAHTPTDHIPEGLVKLAALPLHNSIIPSNTHRLALLQMTPFAWRASPEIRQAITDADNLRIETDFILTLWQKLSYA